MSFNVVVFVVRPFVFRSTRLPLRSKMYLSYSGFFNLNVFSISIRCTSDMELVYTVKTPNIFASKLLGFFK